MSDDLFETRLLEDTLVGFQQPLRVQPETEPALTHPGGWLDRAILTRLLSKLFDYAKAHNLCFSVASVELMSQIKSPEEARKISIVASNLFRSQLRESDTLLQYGLKTMCIILPHADQKRGQKVLARLRGAAAKTAMIGAHDEAVEPVFGLSSDFSGPQSPGENVLAHAELSLKRAVELYLLQPR
ncbi:MAG TPA: hypothetical protein V6D17_01785 [Candidatus Obscuribacterales bacterium]